MQLSLRTCLLEIPGLVIVEFLKNIFCKEVAQKLYKKLHKIVTKLDNSKFFQYLSHSEETFDHELGNFLKNVLRAWFYYLEFFEAFISPTFSNLKQKFTENVGYRQNFDIFDFLLSI